MKKLSYVFWITLLFIIFNACNRGEDLKMYQIDPLYKVFKERSYFQDEIDTIQVVRGEVASIQIVVKALEDLNDMEVSVGQIVSDNPSGSLSNAEAGWVDYVRVGRSYYPPSRDIIRSISDYFPDPIITDSAFSINSGEVQPIWISIPIDKAANPGLYTGTVVITGKVGTNKRKWTKDFFIRVYPVTLETSPLFVTNWSAHFNPMVLSYMNNNEPVELYSDFYWELVKMHADIMASHRQNVHRIYPVWHTKYTYVDGKYTFDFTRFDKEAEMFDKVGALKRIEGGHLAWRSGNWDSPFYVEVPLPDDEDTRKLSPGVNYLKVENNIRFVKLPIEDKRTQNFLDQFLPALKDHLIQKGWLDRYMQHIADEPTDKNSESYRLISNYVKKHLPEVKILDAVLTSKELAGTIDVWVPVLDVLHKDYTFYEDLQKQNKEVWFYTCVVPRGNYANRFIELPLIQTRYLHWINFKYDITGYLHWGLNYWEKDQLNIDASRDRGKLPAGDNAIIYPGYRKLYTSIRFEAMRDGIDDYQLLKMVQAKDPVKARSFANSLIYSFDNYDNSVTYFRKVRKQMLEFLSQK
ncbi:MAG: DUF4091 domain-containing protein [Dysgonamonadaceae bacterium]|nr:DUF4091 domain-containing protein [Dysgonamonadaceae bacterium]